MGEACSLHGAADKCVKIVVWKPERKRPLEVRKHIWEDNIKMDLKERGWL
jgi:hypothetical protein